MSICTCVWCDNFVDSDDDPDCFVDCEIGGRAGIRVVCKNCRQIYQEGNYEEEDQGPETA